MFVSVLHCCFIYYHRTDLGLWKWSYYREINQWTFSASFNRPFVRLRPRLTPHRLRLRLVRVLGDGDSTAIIPSYDAWKQPSFPLFSAPAELAVYTYRAYVVPSAYVSLSKRKNSCCNKKKTNAMRRQGWQRHRHRHRFHSFVFRIVSERDYYV